MYNELVYKRNMNTCCNKIQEKHSVCKNVLQVYLESNVIRDIHVTLSSCRKTMHYISKK